MRIMRAGKMKDIKKLRYPLLASYKLDGIRSRIIGETVRSKNDKRIPNEHCQKLFGVKRLHGVDAELVVGPPNRPDPVGDEPSTMQATNSGVMSRAGEPDVKLYVFDDFTAPGGFNNRYEKLRDRINGLGASLRKSIVILEQRLIHNEAELLAMEQEALDAGYEGLMVRSLDGPYKGGTSTEREGYLLKMKRWEDAEAKIIGFTELMHNGNEKKADGKRSSRKEGKTGLGTLGSLQVIGINGKYKGVEFDVPVPDHKMRDYIWQNRTQCKGKIVKYKFFPSGTKEKPRFPGMLGFRDKRDL